MTIRGKEIHFSNPFANAFSSALEGPLVKLMASQDVRAVVAIGFFVAYLATALIS